MILSNLMQLMTPSAADVREKIVLVRVDFNIPLKQIDGHWRVSDDNRIKAALPTLEFLVQHRAKIVICSHLGRPDGKPNANFSLEPIARHLKTLLRTPVLFSPSIA